MIYLGFLEACLYVDPKSLEIDQPDLPLHFTEDVIRSDSDAFRFLQFYTLM